MAPQIITFPPTPLCFDVDDTTTTTNDSSLTDMLQSCRRCRRLDLDIIEQDHDDILDRIRIMRKQEDDESYSCTSYVATTKQVLSKHGLKAVDNECRKQMCEWCYRLVYHLGLPKETVAVAMSYLDRFLCTDKGRYTLSDRALYRTTAMTTLHIASKARRPSDSSNGISSTKPIEVSFLAKLSRGTCTSHDIIMKEREVLEALKWKLSEPTSFCFITNLMLLMPTTVHADVERSIEDQARIQAEIAVTDSNFSLIKPSCIAFASILNALAGYSIDSISNDDDVTCFSSFAKYEFVNSIEECLELTVEDMNNLRPRLTHLLLLANKRNVIHPEEVTVKQTICNDYIGRRRPSYTNHFKSSTSILTTTCNYTQNGAESPLSPISPISLAGEAFA